MSQWQPWVEYERLRVRCIARRGVRARHLRHLRKGRAGHPEQGLPGDRDGTPSDHVRHAGRARTPHGRRDALLVRRAIPRPSPPRFGGSLTTRIWRRASAPMAGRRTEQHASEAVLGASLARAARANSCQASPTMSSPGPLSLAAWLTIRHRSSASSPLKSSACSRSAPGKEPSERGLHGSSTTRASSPMLGRRSRFAARRIGDTVRLSSTRRRGLPLRGAVRSRLRVRGPRALRRRRRGALVGWLRPSAARRIRDGERPASARSLRRRRIGRRATIAATTGLTSSASSRARVSRSVATARRTDSRSPQPRRPHAMPLARYEAKLGDVRRANGRSARLLQPPRVGRRGATRGISRRSESFRPVRRQRPAGNRRRVGGCSASGSGASAPARPGGQRSPSL